MTKELALTTTAFVADAIARIVAVVTLDSVNKLLATAIAVLSIIHLAIRIRKETRDKE
jgi:hypothetical protein